MPPILDDAFVYVVVIVYRSLVTKSTHTVLSFPVILLFPSVILVFVLNSKNNYYQKNNNNLFLLHFGFTCFVIFLFFAQLKIAQHGFQIYNTVYCISCQIQQHSKISTTSDEQFVMLQCVSLVWSRGVVFSSELINRGQLQDIMAIKGCILHSDVHDIRLYSTPKKRILKIKIRD